MSLPKHTVELHQSLNDLLGVIDRAGAVADRIKATPQVHRARERAAKFDAWLRDGGEVVAADDAARARR